MILSTGSRRKPTRFTGRLRRSRATETPNRIFFLSPAYCGGERARLIFKEEPRFELARKVRTPEGVALGEVFSFMSGLYFRGKLAYARAFARPPSGMPGVWIITPNGGLRRADDPVTLDELKKFGATSVDQRDPRYRLPLVRDCRKLAEQIGPNCEIVLLGSVSTGKYIDLLLELFGPRLRFPVEFLGRGDMSRGGLMLRCVQDQRELEYVIAKGAVRHGKRPPKLPPVNRFTHE